MHIRTAYFFLFFSPSCLFPQEKVQVYSSGLLLKPVSACLDVPNGERRSRLSARERLAGGAASGTDRAGDVD